MYNVTITFNVNGQIISRNEKDMTLLSDSIDLIKARFTFSPEWQGYTKTAIFKSSTKRPYSRILVDDVCMVPPEAIKKSKYMSVSVFGVSGTQLITATDQIVPLTPSGYTDDSIVSPAPTENIYQQIVTLMQNQAVDARIATAAETSAAESADSAQISATTAATAKDDAVAAKIASQIAQGLAEGARDSALDKVISTAQVNELSHLILTYADNTTVDTGYVKGDKGDTGDKGDIGEQGPKGDKGDVGPKGDKGDTGEQGEQGIQGPKGDTGNQGPQGIQGPKGDKGDTGLQGIQGAAGVDGLSIEYIWNGTSLGIRQEGQTTYQYVNLKGDQGIQGPKGDTGAKGEQGIQGIKGNTGAEGKSLEFTWNGTQLGVRVQGTIIYQYVNLKGEKGDTGPQGIQGEAGPKGATGTKGDKGDTGEQGIQGIPGLDGKSLEVHWNGTQLGIRIEGETTYQYVNLKGEKGDRGIQGASGLQGIQGEPGIQGEIGPQGETGKSIEYNWNGTELGIRVEGELSYQYVNLRGPQGVRGSQGEIGPRGIQGLQGEQGAKGDDGYTPIKGIDYFDGERGPQGVDGPKGDTGPRGEKGDKGDKGDTGATGAKGDKGDTGAQGIPGLSTGKKVVRFVIGTSTAGWTSADCDYLCDGTADQAKINAAITALPATGGEIVILDGTYNITAKIDVTKDNVSIRGNGNATILKRMFNSASAEGVITLTSRSGCKIADLQVDGNKTSYTNNMNNYGIYLYSSSNNTFTGNTCNNNNTGIYLRNSNNNIVTGNICNNNSSGIYLYSSSNNTFTGNTYNNNNTGFYLYSSSNNNTITGNTCDNDTYAGIYLYSSSHNTFTGNTFNNNKSGIHLYSSSNNTLTGNTCIRGTGLATDYTESQHTIYLYGTGNNYNLIAMNNCMGKAVTNEGGTGNTLANNKFNAT